MTIKQFIEKAKKGGWDESDSFTQYVERASHTPNILLDPEAWKAVGKVEGWERTTSPEDYTPFQKGTDEPFWIYQMHRMIDALAEGKTLEQFIETL